MKGLPLILLASLVCSTHARAAPADVPGDSLSARVRTLRAVCAHLDTLSVDDVLSDTVSVAHLMATAIMDVLRVPGLTDHQIDTIFKDLPLGRARSADGRLHVFSFDEMTGGTFRSEAHVVFYRTATGTGVEWAPTDEDDLLCGLGAGYNEVYLVQRTDTSSVYVCIGSTVGCATCIADVINVIELGPQGINFDYPAFAQYKPEEAGDEDGEDDEAEKEEAEPERFEPCMSIDMRFGDGILFEYDPKRRMFSYAYMAYDPNAAQEGQRMKVSGTITWNGRYFVEREE